MLRLAIAAFAALLSCAALAQGAKVDRIELVGTGVYQVETGPATAATGSPTGSVTSVTTVKNLQSTTTIMAKTGLEFGLQYRIVGAPDGAEVNLDIVNIYPPIGLREPTKSEPIRESRYTLRKKIGETHYLGYGFENEWEVVAGTWTFQIWQDGRKLLEQSFAVTK